jgi:hypothetical protein
VGIFSRFVRFKRFFLAHDEELEVSLVYEPDEDANSVSRFKFKRDEVGVVFGCQKPFVDGCPARVLVSRPSSSTKPSPEEFLDVGTVVAILFDVVGTEIVLKDVVGHVAIVNNNINNKIKKSPHRTGTQNCSNESLDSK